MPNAVRKQLTGRGPVGNTAVVGAKDRATKHVAATDKATLPGFVQDHADRQARVYTDEASACETLRFEHESVKHLVSEYVRGQAHTNGVEPFWSISSAATTGRSTSSARSIWTASCRSSPAVATCAIRTPSTRWARSCRAWTASGSGTRI